MDLVLNELQRLICHKRQPTDLCSTDLLEIETLHLTVYKQMILIYLQNVFRNHIFNIHV